MATLIRNKLRIIPNAYSKEEYDKQINDVASFCSALEDGKRKHMSFIKICPKPLNIEIGSKEEDDWMLHNWGTRFKALNACRLSEDEMIFDTFWNPAVPIFIKLAKKFPNVDFNFKFASKRTGMKAGELAASGGKVILFNRFDNCSREAYETAFELMPHLRMLYTLNQNTGTYDYDTSDFRASIEQNGYYKDQDGTVLIGCDDKQKPLFDEVDDLPF
jgi:hypothetical protein